MCVSKYIYVEFINNWFDLIYLQQLFTSIWSITEWEIYFSNDRERKKAYRFFLFTLTIQLQQ